MEMTVHAWVTENMPNIFGWALSRVGDRHEAEDLAGDIMAAMLACGDRAVGSRNAYLWRIAHNVYVSYLRKKRPTEALSETLIDDAPTAEEVLLESEQIRLLRRELSLLSEQYRTAAALYYDARMSCTAIASRLGISTEMVKYYLFRARKLIREGMNMERILGEKSWNPQTFEIDFWGSRGGSMAEYSRFQKRKLPGNILLAAYYSRVSAQELAMELGVALPYLEDELAILTERGYLTESGGKYLTNVPVFTTECTGRIKSRAADAAAAAIRAYIAAEDGFKAEFGGRLKDENMLRWHVYMLCCIAAMRVTGDDLGALPTDGVYRQIMDGCGIVWGRAANAGETIEFGLAGIYTGAGDGGAEDFICAYNFAQNGQRYQGGLDKEAFADPEVVHYTHAEFERALTLVQPRAAYLTALMREISSIAAEVTAELAPAHIRREAEYAGAMVYRFNGIDNAAGALIAAGWLVPTQTGKPTMCAVVG